MSTDLDLGHTVSYMLTLRIRDQSFRIPDVVVDQSSTHQLETLA